MVEGRRITDEATLEIAIMVYAGLINKQIVALLQSLGTNAIGLTGADANAILAHKRVVKEIDYGWVGDVDDINKDGVKALLSVGLVPVFSPITHDGQGQLLNTNADTIASVIAVAMAEEYHVSLKYCFEYPGVLYNLDNPKKTIKSISEDEFATMKQDSSINEGMIPKLSNGLNALRNGVHEVAICGIDNLLDLDNATKLIL
jgi:acetylglutamate kinase